MKEIYEWNQTPKTLTIKIPTAFKVDPKNLNSEITEYYLQYNILDVKKHGIIYFFDKVEFESSNIKIYDNYIEFFIHKESEENWPNLEPKISKEELNKRKKFAKENYDKKIQDNRLKAQENKKAFEKFVIDKSMKLDEEKRKELLIKKTAEKSMVENELYDFVNKFDQKEKNISNEESINKTIEIKEKSEDVSLSKSYKENKNFLQTKEKIKNEEINYSKNKNFSKQNLTNDIFLDEQLKTQDKDGDNNNKNYEDNYSSITVYDKKEKEKINNNTNEIFDDKIIENNKYQIRNESKINVNLTEKAIPHFAARESLSKEPPYPKSKTFVPEKNHVIKL